MVGEVSWSVRTVQVIHEIGFERLYGIFHFGNEGWHFGMNGEDQVFLPGRVVFFCNVVP